MENRGGSRQSHWRRAALVAVVLAAALPAPAPARTPTVKQQLVQVRRTVGHLAPGLFAARARKPVLRLATRAATRARHGKPCPTLTAVDALRSRLATPQTWKSGKVPRRALRSTSRLLRSANRRLLRSAGKRCARPAAVETLKPQTGGEGSPKTPSPDTPSEQGEGLQKEIPPGPFRPFASLGGPSGAGGDPFGGPGAPSGRATAHTATDPLTFFRTTDVGVPPRQICCPEEVNAAIAGNAGWYTGNGSVGLSTNGGRTWTLFDPSNVLPDLGLGFCCDQLVSYSPSYDMFVWVSQYWCNTACVTSDHPARCQTGNTFNRVRIAVARPSDLIAHASNPGLAWTFWDITPQTIGQPRNAWFDRSDLSVNPVNANWNVDIICGSAGSMLGRISLAQLAARGTVTLGYITPGGRYTSTQGLGTTSTYFAGNTSLSQARIWSWAPYSGTLFPHDVNHSSIPIYDNAMIGSDSNNLYDRYGIFPGEVESSTISGSTLYMAQGTGRAYCTSHCDDDATRVLNHVLDQPAVLVTKVNLNTWAGAGERWLWNPTIGFGYPAMATDGAGDVGIALRANTPGTNARPVAGFLTPSEQFTFALPAGLPYEIGDYYSLRPGRTSQTFAMTAETVQNDVPGGVRRHWNYIEYGHGPAPYVAPPSVHITAPANLSAYAQNAVASYSATVSDPVDGNLPSAAIRWTEDGTPIGTGTSITHTESATGTHAITVTATNGDGRSASDTITIRVNPPPGPLHAQITVPKDQSDFGYSPFDSKHSEYCQDIQFQATIDGGTAPYTYSWDDVRTLSGKVYPSQQLSTAAPPVTLTLCGGSSANESSSHDVTLTVHDSASNVATSSVRVYVESYKLARRR